MKRRKYLTFLIIPILGICIVSLLYYYKQINTAKTSVAITTPFPSSNVSAEPTAAPTDAPKDLSNIYSFFQGPKAYEKQLTWSGPWANEYYDGNKFGSFGCGLCCMANIYCTLTDYVCCPVDMYQCAKEHSAYHPTYGYGAIDWPAMIDTLSYCGISSQIKNKPETYEEFQTDIEQALSTIVLVSSYNSTEYWTNTPGHYVTLWNYDKENDTVFLTDSGNISHNRNTVPLHVIYNSLKTSNAHQYLLITEYNQDNNRWTWNQFSEEWNRP